MTNIEGVVAGGKAGGQDVEELLKRARQDAPDDEDREGKEDRYVFQGTKASSLDTPLLRSNRKAIRRKYSTFNIIFLLFLAAFGIVMYISNIISVNHLASDVSHLQGKLDAIINARSIVQAEINRKSSWERIGQIATEELGLRFAHGQATWIALDEELLERIETR